jgi:predicted phosphodiesterase
MFPTQDDYGYLKAMSVAEDLLEVCVQDINSHYQEVDFTLVLGDISDEGKSWELERAAVILGGLDAPYYPVVGNHDNFQDDNKQAWKDAFGRDSTSYVVTWEGFKFIVIDPTLDPYDPPDHMVRFDEDLREWVRGELEEDPEMPTFLVGHYPLLNRCWTAAFRVFNRVGRTCLSAEDGHFAEDTPSSPRGYPDPEYLNYYRVYPGGRELREVLEDHPNVIASLNGHVHANRAEEYKGITYIDVAATLVGRPCVRYFYVYPDRVEADFEYISDTDLFDHVSGMCPYCLRCTYPNSVCGFIDGRLEDKRFTIHF